DMMKKINDTKRFRFELHREQSNGHHGTDLCNEWKGTGITSMEHRNLVTFLRVAELQNFTRAANELGYAQSTVTFHIQTLEEELGVSLFDRIGKKVKLTKAGEYLVNYANEMERIISDMAQISNTVNMVRGTLRIGVVESLLATYMVEALSRYSKSFPDVNIEVVTGSTAGLMELLRSNDVDLIFVMGSRIVDFDFVRAMIQEAGVSFVASSSHPLAGKEEIGFEEIAADRMILPEKSSLYRKSIEMIAGKTDCIFAPVIQVNNTTSILGLLKTGNGISYLPDYLTREGVEDGSLTILNVRCEPQKYYIQILYHRNKWISPQMTEFINLIKDLMIERPEP
ncbi:MAG: LysR family transcriptional regulator, partial [Stomatobaculum sp.]|nr:LysR family transcriptional regulator [Stomatobaculum sp.]